jgi:hypothetical protein
MNNRIIKVENYFSFKPDSDASNYFLSAVNDSVKNQLIKLVNRLEKSPQVYLCVRGDSKRDIDAHNKIFEKDLSKIFIVGEKSRSNRRTYSNETHIHYDSHYRNLIHEIEQIISEVNEELLAKPASHKISGIIPQSFINDLQNLDLEKLEKWKIFFLVFLHNNGNNKSFNNYSPFISLTYGPNKYVTARKFALKNCSHKKGILFLYCLNAGWPYYISTNNFTKELKNFGVIWYKDKHSEIMLIGGMYPHYLIGIYEVEPLKNPRFIINPWLYDIMLRNEEFDYFNGLPIDQTYFHSFAEELGYRNFFFHYLNDNDEYVSELNQYNHNKVYRP